MDSIHELADSGDEERRLQSGARHEGVLSAVAIPIGPALAPLVDFLIGCLILGGLMGWYRFVPSWHNRLLPIFTLFAILTALSVGLWLAALNVRYRDVQYAMPFIDQLWMYATPVAYSVLIFPLWLRPYIGLNPMAGVVQGFRWCLLGSQAGRSAT